MNRRKLGRIDLQVSELCLGTANFGWQVDEAVAVDLLDRFHAAGGNFLQTCAVGADDVRDPDTTGVSETYVGRWLKSRGIPRDHVVLATRHGLGSAAGRTDLFRLAASIRQSCEESLRRLDVRYLDLLVLEWHEGLPMEEALIAAETLVRAGMIRHVVASGFPVWRVMEWIAHSARRRLCRFEAMQHEFSVVSNAELNAEAFALCQAHRLGFIARAPLAGGLVPGRPTSPFTPVNGGSAPAALAAMDMIARTHDCSPARVALAWALAHDGVSSAVIDVRSLAQLDELLPAAAFDLALAEIRCLDRLWKSGAERAPCDGSPEAEVHDEDELRCGADLVTMSNDTPNN